MAARAAARPSWSGVRNASEPVRKEGGRNQRVVTSLFCQERGVATDVDCFRSPPVSPRRGTLRNRRDRCGVRPDRAAAAGGQAWRAGGGDRAAREGGSAAL